MIVWRRIGANAWMIDCAAFTRVRAPGFKPFWFLKLSNWNRTFFARWQKDARAEFQCSLEKKKKYSTAQYSTVQYSRVFQRKAWMVSRHGRKSWDALVARAGAQVPIEAANAACYFASSSGRKVSEPWWWRAGDNERWPVSCKQRASLAFFRPCDWDEGTRTIETELTMLVASSSSSSRSCFSARATVIAQRIRVRTRRRQNSNPDTDSLHVKRCCCCCLRSLLAAAANAQQEVTEAAKDTSSGVEQDPSWAREHWSFGTIHAHARARASKAPSG